MLIPISFFMIDLLKAGTLFTPKTLKVFTVTLHLLSKNFMNTLLLGRGLLLLKASLVYGVRKESWQLELYKEISVTAGSLLLLQQSQNTQRG